VQVTGLEGIVSTYGYDPANDRHNLTSTQEGQGTATWTMVYDERDRVVQQTRGDRVIAFDYSTPLRTVVTRTRKDHTDASLPSATDVFEYTPSGQLTRRVDPLGNETRHGLDAQNFRVKTELWWNQGTLAAPSLVLQKTTLLGYDLDGNLTSRAVTLDSGETVTESWTYDQHWVASYEVVSSAAPSKLFRTEHTFLRDASGRPRNIQDIKRRRDNGTYQVTELAYDANGQLASVTPQEVSPADGLRLVRTYFTPPEAHMGLLEEESLEVGGSPDAHGKRSFGYDAAGFLDEVTDARDFTTTFANDDLGRVTSVTNPLGETTLYTYAGATLGLAPGSWTPGTNLAEVEVGRTVADGEGQVRRLRWDAEGRLRTIERKDDAGSFGTFASYSYDSDDLRTRETDALSRTIVHAYDPLGRLTSTTDAATSPNITAFAYDAAGNRVQVTDALGRKTVLAYDDLDRLLSSQAQGSPAQPLRPALTTSFQYDAAGNVTKVIDPKAQETTYTYSALSELTAVTQHLGQTVAYAYDPRGRLARTTNARGQALVQVYEPWGGISEVRHYPTSGDADAGTNLQRTVSYAFDNSGNVTETGDTDYSPTSPTLETTAYDELDRPDLVTVHYVPGGARMLASGYDRFGNRKSLVFTDGADVMNHAWTYDKLNRLVEAELASPNPLEFTYFANDDLETITHGNGVTTEYTYFPEGPVATITVESPSEQLLKLTYTVNKVLNVTAMNEQHAASGATHAYTYGYDALDRLTSATYPTVLGLPASEAFTYDAAGNREDPSNAALYDYDANNRITASPGKVWVYDGDGNPVSVNAGTGAQETFAHDAQNRMRGYTNMGTGAAASYAYDSFARRVRKSVNGAVAWFIWDRNKLLAQFDGSGQRGRRYTYSGGFPPTEQATSIGTSEDVQQLHVDRLDTPRATSSNADVVTWRASYRAFGIANQDEDPDGDLTSVSVAVRFPGQLVDGEGLFHYNVNRVYFPEIGRYGETDPLGQLGIGRRRQISSLYAYALNSPVTAIDPLGLDVVNTSDPDDVTAGPVFVLPEEGKTAADIKCVNPGGTFEGGQDGLAIPGYDEVFKTTDWNDAVVDPDGSITTWAKLGPLGFVFFGPVQFFRGGALSGSEITTAGPAWEALRAAAEASVGECRCP
jgi:RHS repeat-associated protein